MNCVRIGCLALALALGLGALGCGDARVVYPSDTTTAPPVETSRSSDRPPTPIPPDQLGR